MIKYTKKATLTNNGHDQDFELEKRTFYTIEDAIKHLQKTKINFYIEDKAPSIIESAEVLEIRHAQSESPTIKRYYKIVDKQTGEVITNIKES